MKGIISVTGTDNTNSRKKKLTFKNNAPFILRISKISNTFVDNVEDRDVVMQLYNLLEHSDDYFITSGSLWNYYRHEVNDTANKNDAPSNKINNNKTATSKYFEHQKKLIECTSNINSRLNTEVVVP